jgi:16S rRNA (cytosine1402-N4)-methyltransferase
MKSYTHHISVLAQEVSDFFVFSKEDTIVVDCTGGFGGHAQIFLDKVGEHGRVITFDQDREAILHLKKRFSKEISSGQLTLIQAPFSKITEELEHLGVNKVDAVFADIGVSTHHLKEAERGFSFDSDGPLDMRMDPDSGVSAAEFVNTSSPQDLIFVLRTYGEEKEAKRIVRAIISAREKSEIKTTKELADIIKSVIPFYKRKKNPATKTFQALRIYINSELDELKKLLEQGFSLLAQGGRFGVISFHSLEDRLVKHKFSRLSGRNQQDFPREVIITQEQLDKFYPGKIIKPFPATPSADEIKENPSSRSALLRIIEKK